MDRPSRPSQSLEQQYKDPSNLNARARLHAEFSTNTYGWCRWVFDQFDLPERCRILELGCGQGWLWRQNLQRVPLGWDITLSDFSPGMLDTARETLADAERAFSFEAVDAQSLPFGDETFDTIIANHMLYHVPDLDGALDEIRRVLKKGGAFYATTNGVDHMAELRDLARLLVPELRFTRNHNTEAFGLENGEAILSKFFADVTLRRYEDSLEVPEAAPLVAWVLSAEGAAEAFTDEKTAELRRLIDQRIATDGLFRVTKSVGMLAARHRKQGLKGRGLGGTGYQPEGRP